MSVWALSDLHLSFGVPDKTMDIFGAAWEDHAEKIAVQWHRLVSQDDLVLIAGDISWAMRPEEVEADLAWIDALPGTKVMIRGNHDYWWGSLSKVKRLLPPSLHAIQHDSFTWGPYAIGGTRLWESSTLPGFLPEGEDEAQAAEREKIFLRELGRLEMSLKTLDPNAEQRIVMTHYPPIGIDLQPSLASALLEKYQVDIVIFGHLHNLPPGSPCFGKRAGILYQLTSCDFLNFTPLRLL